MDVRHLIVGEIEGELGLVLRDLLVLGSRLIPARS